MKTAVKLTCRPISDAERAMIGLLRLVKCMPGTADFRFVRQMTAALQISNGRSEPLEITDGQAAYLQRMIDRYRRQIYPNGWPSNVQERPALD